MSRACTRALLPSLQWGNRGTNPPQEVCAFGCEDAVLVPTPARCPSSSWPPLKVLCSPQPPLGAQGDPKEAAGGEVVAGAGRELPMELLRCTTSSNFGLHHPCFTSSAQHKSPISVP